MFHLFSHVPESSSHLLTYSGEFCNKEIGDIERAHSVMLLDVISQDAIKCCQTDY